ncbi:class I tRNA ligase family protein, partial [Glaesserella parasuis]|uniref:class I tRNA ligase family protein n=1 Tax=Glaesserella parasuis TaxID=738 RepID=UPI003F2D6C7B
KSKLTGIAPTEITDTFGSDAYRFYFLSAIAFGQDGSFSWEDLSARYQAELANGFGNLASRSIAMIERYFEGIVPPAGEYTDADLAIQKTVADAASNADAAIERFRIDEAI